MTDWCRGKEKCNCPSCRTDLNDNDLRNLGLGEEIILRRRIKGFIAYHVENIRDSLARNDIPPIPTKLRRKIRRVVYREGGPRERFLNMILIFVEIYTRNFNENIMHMNNETDKYGFSRILQQSVETIYESIPDIMRTINDEFPYEYLTLYPKVEQIMKGIIDFIDVSSMQSISDPNSPYYEVITFI
jgi:hypothetical protein